LRFEPLATDGTTTMLEKAGLKVQRIFKLQERSLGSLLFIFHLPARPFYEFTQSKSCFWISFVSDLFCGIWRRFQPLQEFFNRFFRL
jgi:hypothetical protein